jgi:hypothetical protein
MEVTMARKLKKVNLYKAGPPKDQLVNTIFIIGDVTCDELLHQGQSVSETLGGAYFVARIIHKSLGDCCQVVTYNLAERSQLLRAKWEISAFPEEKPTVFRCIDTPRSTIDI